MKRPDHSSQPRVPEIFTTLTIERIAYDTPYFIAPRGHEDYEAPAIFVAPGAERQLCMSKDEVITIENEAPNVPLSHVGIMKTVWINEATGMPEDVYLADLRLMGEHQLVDFNTLRIAAMEEDDVTKMRQTVTDSVRFAGLITAEEDFDAEDGLPEGTFYGDESLVGAATRLSRSTDVAFARFISSVASDEREDSGTAEPNQTEALQASAKEKPLAKLTRFILRR